MNGDNIDDANIPEFIANICANSVKILNFQTVLEVVVMPILLIVGIFGNSLTIYLISEIRTHYLNYYYLKWIAYLNIVTIIFSWSLTSVNTWSQVNSKYFDSKYFLDFTYKFTLICTNGFYTTSVFSLCLLLLDRYVSIKDQNLFNSFKGSKLMRFVPYPILISCNLHLSNYLLFDMESCYFIPRGTANYSTWHFNQSSNFVRYYKVNLDGPHWISSYELFRQILLSIFPGLVILYLGILTNFAPSFSKKCV
ncbi:unnamed protein product [Gordionus sp. m RMFG-2023]